MVGSHAFLTCRLATGVWFMGFWVFFFLSSSATVSFSYHQNKPVTGFPAVCFLLFSFISIVRPVKAATW